MAVITLLGLRVRGFHGVLPVERANGQDFLVDARLDIPDPADDDLARTVDYGDLAVRLADVVSGEPVELLETLVQRLLAVCLDRPHVRFAEVTVHKPQAPIPLDFADVTVSARGGRRQTAVLSIGSNVGDRLAHLGAAVRLCRTRGRCDVSSVYETDPVGGPDQEPFLNAVVRIPADHPAELLRFAHAVEASRDRQRAERWGPRTLDVDLIDVDGLVLDEPTLTLPHPRAAERAFVLVPWLEVDPDAALPTSDGTLLRVADLVAELDGSGVRRTDLQLPDS